MNITDVKIRKIYSNNRLRALVSITIDNVLAIHDIKIIQGTNRIFVAMPSRKEENGTFKDIVHPIVSSARKDMEDVILAAYSNYLDQHSDGDNNIDNNNVNNDNDSNIDNDGNIDNADNIDNDA